MTTSQIFSTNLGGDIMTNNLICDMLLLSSVTMFHIWITSEADMGCVRNKSNLQYTVNTYSVD